MSTNSTDQVSRAPVFVLCTARSGSTLLRSILNQHPSLYCPAETNLAQIVASSSWLEAVDRILGTEELLSDPKYCQPIVDTVTEIMESSAKKQGKTVWCDKSLVNVANRELLRTCWPHAKFIFIYRHVMDVIDSAIRAQPWGLRGYGFAPFAMSSPDNNVEALGRYWGTFTSGMLEAESQWSNDVCRIRYEDLVAHPHDVARGIYEFLDLEEHQLDVDSLLGAANVRMGSDHKLPHHKDISMDSVGCGMRVADRLLSDELKMDLNDLLKRLDYVLIDSEWGCPTEWRDEASTGCKWYSGKDPTREGHLESLVGVAVLEGTRSSLKCWVDAKHGTVVREEIEACPGHPVVTVAGEAVRRMRNGDLDVADAIRERSIRAYHASSSWAMHEDMVMSSVLSALSHSDVILPKDR